MAESNDTLPRDKCRTVARSCMGFSIRKAARAVAQVYDEALLPSGLRGTQFSLLNAIALMGSPSINQLADTLVMDRTTLTRNLNPLVTQGLINIVTGVDRRTRAVTLLAKGRKVLAKALPLWDQAQSRLTQGLGSTRTKRLLVDLGEVVQLAHPE